ncbi:MAG: selenide, water dikinase SelD [bacterium]|nr:selenide, water dikinase SelD [bacterium]
MLAKLPDTRRPELLVGYETSDDAAVYALTDEQALVATADFITPVLDDPRAFGAAAAANSLSDVYAMGGTPLLALNLCGFPEKALPPEVMGEIFAGAAAVCREAGVVVGGGHTVRDDEVKFGLAVTGVVHPQRILRNSAARPGDLLVLTKPLGTGALAAALKQGLLPETGPDYAALVGAMTALNRCGAFLHACGVRACTDVTGFGLAGHAAEMALGAGVQLRLDTAALPLLPDAVGLCGRGFTCGGTRSNRAFGASRVGYAPSLGEDVIGLVNDPQTSGGLLFAVPPERCEEARATALAHGALCAAVIGDVLPLGAGSPPVFFR